MEDVDVQIACQPVSRRERMAFLPKHFGKRYLQGEAMLFDWARRLCAQYSGGSWAFFDLSNGGFYVAPEMKSPVEVSWSLNGYQGRMSIDAFGIVVTLFTLCHMAELCGDPALTEKYYALHAFALQHAECKEIFKAID